MMWKRCSFLSCPPLIWLDCDRDSKAQHLMWNDKILQHSQMWANLPECSSQAFVWLQLLEEFRYGLDGKKCTYNTQSNKWFDMDQTLVQLPAAVYIAWVKIMTKQVRCYPNLSFIFDQIQPYSMIEFSYHWFALTNVIYFILLSS